MGYKFTDLEKHYILSRAWHEYHPSIMKAMDESATGQVWNSAVAGWTEDQRVEFQRFDGLVFQAYRRRVYEAMRLMTTAEGLKAGSPTVPPEVDLEEVVEAGFKKRTFTIGMYTAWFTTKPWEKGEDEDDDAFERRKAGHGYEFGYVCKEAIIDSIFPRDDIHKELERARETINNIAAVINNARNK